MTKEQSTADGSREVRLPLLPLRLSATEELICDSRGCTLMPAERRYVVETVNAHPTLTSERDGLLMFITDIRNVLVYKQAKGKLSGAEESILQIVREVIDE